MSSSLNRKTTRSCRRLAIPATLVAPVALVLADLLDLAWLRSDASADQLMTLSRALKPLGRSESNNLAPEYVAARSVLLDALVALEGHLDNLIRVGAQAVYHHTGEADLNIPLMTTDADLAINAVDLAEVPEIGAVLRTAGFTLAPTRGTRSPPVTSRST